MHEVEASETDDKLGQLLDRVEAGKDIVIARRGRTVAHLVRPRPVSDGGAEAAAAAIRAMSRGVTPGGLSLRDLVAEDRR